MGGEYLEGYKMALTHVAQSLAIDSSAVQPLGADIVIEGLWARVQIEFDNGRDGHDQVCRTN